MKHESSMGSLWFWLIMLLVSFGVVLVVWLFRPDIFGIVHVLNSYPTEYVLFMVLYMMVPISMSFLASILLHNLYAYVCCILAEDREG